MIIILSALARCALACAVASASTPVLIRSASSKSPLKTIRLMEKELERREKELERASERSSQDFI
eukprot:3922236-Prymnesium_polylepis.1